MFDPVYGELITSKKVSEMTGLTLNQLRNFRMPTRLDKAPFPFVRIGGTTLYRKDDVMLWLQDNSGSIQIEYVKHDSHKPAPLLSDPVSIEKRESYAKLGRITTQNSWTSMATWFVEQSGFDNGTQFVHDQGRRLLAIERGIADWKTIGRPNNEMKGSDPEAFWKIWTYGVRKGYATVNNLDVTDEDIMSVPIGDVPPLKTN